MTLKEMASLADNMLDLVLGEQLTSPVEHSVEQYPCLVYYYPNMV